MEKTNLLIALPNAKEELEARGHSINRWTLNYFRVGDSVDESKMVEDARTQCRNCGASVRVWIIEGEEYSHQEGIAFDYNCVALTKAIQGTPLTEEEKEKSRRGIMQLKKSVDDNK